MEKTAPISREVDTLRKLALTLAAIGLATAPIAAQTNDTDTTGEDSGVFGGASAAPIILFALAALAVGIYASGDDEPVSA